MVVGSGFSRFLADKARIAFPITKDFLRIARQRTENEGSLAQFWRFMREIESAAGIDLSSASAQADLDRLDVEGIYDMVDVSAKLSEDIWAGTSPFDPFIIRQQLQRMIAMVLVSLSIDNRVALAEACAGIINRLRPDAILTLNWDTIVDMLLQTPGEPIQYNVAGQPPMNYFIPKPPDFYGCSNDDFLRWHKQPFESTSHPSIDQRFTLYKLHGSLNWFSCRDNNHFLIGDPDAAYADFVDPDTRCPIDSSKVDPLILPPASSKDYAQKPFPQIWRGAFEKLRFAKEIIFFGCSIREADFRLRDLIFKTHLWQRPRHFIPSVKVIDSDSASVKKKLKDLFGFPEIGEINPASL